jgi:hypothetical protein
MPQERVQQCRKPATSNSTVNGSTLSMAKGNLRSVREHLNYFLPLSLPAATLRNREKLVFIDSIRRTYIATQN